MPHTTDDNLPHNRVYQADLEGIRDEQRFAFTKPTHRGRDFEWRERFTFRTSSPESFERLLHGIYSGGARNAEEFRGHAAGTVRCRWAVWGDQKDEARTLYVRFVASESAPPDCPKANFNVFGQF